jgi:fluoroquinolone resistance protein
MQHVEFTDCKLQGIQWSHCSNFLFEAAFTRCILNFCSFIQKKMQKTMFTECRLEEVDFTETDISESIFDRCDLARALFQDTNLTNVDFTTSYDYVLNPEENTIK